MCWWVDFFTFGLNQANCSGKLNRLLPVASYLMDRRESGVVFSSNARQESE